MSTINIIHNLKRMDLMIRMKCTGKPDEFASRLGVSERTLYNYLALLKELGATVNFSRTSSSYFYVEDGRIHMEYEKLFI